MSARLMRIGLALLAAFLIAGALVVGRESGLVRRSADFTIFYAAAQLVRDGHPQAVYQPERLGPLMLGLSDGAIDPRLPFDAPLALLVPFLPLTLLPLEAAFHLWQLLTLGMLALAILLLQRWMPLGGRQGVLALAVLAGFPATWALLSEGQASGLLLLGAALLTGAWTTGSAGLGFAGGLLLALKPQYLPAYMILIAARRQWRALAGALLGGAAVTLSPLLSGGFDGLRAMITSALAAGHGWLGSNESLAGSLAPLLPGHAGIVAAFVVWSVSLGWLAVIAARSRGSDAIGVLATTVAVLLSPHALPYDLVLLAVPAWLAASVHRSGAIASPAPAYGLVALALAIDLGRPLLSLVPLVMLAALGWYGRDFWIRRRHPPAVSAAA
jgi:Glycosyltransferase family 87